MILRKSPFQAQVWMSKKIVSPETPSSPNYLTLLRTVSLSLPSPVTVKLSRDCSKLSRDCPNEPRDNSVQYYPDTHITRSCRFLRITVSTYGSDRWIGDLQILGDVGILSNDYLKESKWFYAPLFDTIFLYFQDLILPCFDNPFKL